MWYVGSIAIVLGLMSAWVYFLNPPLGQQRDLFEKNGPLEGD